MSLIFSQLNPIVGTGKKIEEKKTKIFINRKEEMSKKACKERNCKRDFLPVLIY